MKKLLFLLVVYCVLLCLKNKYKRNIKNTYLFLQQREDTCHLCCLYNFKLLQQIREGLPGGNIHHQTVQSMKKLNKTLCYAIDTKLAVAWHHHVVGMSSNNNLLKNYPLIREYFEQSFANGIILPHIYVDAKKKQNIFHKYGFKGLFLFYAMPVSCTNYDHLKNIHVNIFGIRQELKNVVEFPAPTISFPYYVTNNGEKYIFNMKREAFEEYNPNSVCQIADYYGVETGKVECISNFSKQPGIEPGINKENCHLFLIRAQDQNCIYLYLPTNTCKKKKFAWQRVNNNKGIGLNHVGDRIVVHGPSILHLFLLLVGVDSDNNTIHEEHSMYKYMNEFKKSLNENSVFRENMWNKRDNKYINQRCLFQYRVAQILKKNKKLFHNIESIFQSFSIPFWNVFKCIGNYYNEHGVRINKTEYKKFTLGKYQMMAYTLSILIWLLWKGSIRVAAFTDALQVPPVIGKCLWKKFVFHMHKRNKNGVSMIDVIETLSANIHKGKVLEFFSLSSHGYVISYKQDLIDLQMNCAKNVNDLCLLKKLPAIIDSWNANKMKGIFYISSQQF